MNDIRKVFPECEEKIKIIGNMKEILTEKSFNKMRDIGYLEEVGYDGECSYIKLRNLFTLEEIIKKIEQIGDSNVE